MNARYYDPGTRQFTQEDTYAGNINNPETLNRYSYCAGNPVMYSDPSGHFLYNDIDNPYLGGYDDDQIQALMGPNYDINKDLGGRPNWVPGPWSPDPLQSSTGQSDSDQTISQAPSCPELDDVVEAIRLSEANLAKITTDFFDGSYNVGERGLIAYEFSHTVNSGKIEVTTAVVGYHDCNGWNNFLNDEFEGEETILNDENMMSWGLPALEENPEIGAYAFAIDVCGFGYGLCLSYVENQEHNYIVSQDILWRHKSYIVLYLKNVEYWVDDDFNLSFDDVSYEWCFGKEVSFPIQDTNIHYC